MYRYVEAYDSFTKEVVPKIQQNNKFNASYFGYSSVEIAGRMHQAIVALFLNPYVSYCARRSLDGESSQQDYIIRADKLSLDLNSGSICLSISSIVTRYVEFIFHWFHVLVYALCLVPFNSRCDINIPSIVLLGVGDENLIYEGDDSRFRKFCNVGPVSSLSGGNQLIIQSRLAFESQDPCFSYARFPLHYLISNIQLGFVNRVIFLILHVFLLIKVLVMFVHKPILSLLARDFAYHQMMKTLNHNKLVTKVLFTNSAYTSQPLWARGAQFSSFTTEMIWYSQNIIPFVFRSNNIQSDMPNYLHMKIDKHWVWTQGLADYLKKVGHAGDVEVVGPILWYLDNNYSKIPFNKTLRVALFDLTPITDTVADRIGLCGNYYDSYTMKRFLIETIDVLSTVTKENGLGLQIVVKSKRAYSSTHSNDYIELLSKYESECKYLTVLESTTNIYDILADIDMVIVVPYSSPAYIADSVDVPAVFYDPVCVLKPTYEKSGCVSFTSGKEALSSYVKELSQHVIDNKN